MRLPPALSLFIVLLIGCGGSTASAPPPATSEIDEHTRLAQEDCDTCRDRECFDAARSRLRESIEAAGGFDELPASAYHAHQRLQHCAIAYTDDVPLSIARARQTVCACTTAECVTTFAQQWPVLLEDLEGSAESEQAEAEADRQSAAQCLAARSVEVTEYTTISSEAAERVCACGTLSCAQEAMDERRDRLAGRAYIAAEPGATRAADQRTCECFSQLVVRSTAESLSQLLGGVAFSTRWSIQCEVDAAGGS